MTAQEHRVVLVIFLKAAVDEPVDHLADRAGTRNSSRAMHIELAGPVHSPHEGENRISVCLAHKNAARLADRIDDIVETEFKQIRRILVAGRKRRALAAGRSVDRDDVAALKTLLFNRGAALNLKICPRYHIHSHLMPLLFGIAVLRDPDARRQKPLSTTGIADRSGRRERPPGNHISSLPSSIQNNPFFLHFNPFFIKY